MGAVAMALWVTACTPPNIINPPATATPTTSSPTPTLTPTGPSPTSTATASITPTAISTATSTATVASTLTPEISACGTTPLNQFLDSYAGSSSLSNYTFFTDGNATPTTSSALNISVNSGELQEAATNVNYGTHAYGLVNNAQFSTSLSNYTVEADFKLDARTNNYSVFGLAFLEQSDVSGYLFEWNGNIEHGSTPHWQVEKDTSSVGSSYTYLSGSGFGTGAATPVYTPGNWVHLKVVVSGGGTTYNCYANLYDGNGDQLVFSNETDTTGGTVYTSGAVGFRGGYLQTPNMLHIRNYHAFTCP